MNTICSKNDRQGRATHSATMNRGTPIGRKIVWLGGWLCCVYIASSALLFAQSPAQSSLPKSPNKGKPTFNLSVQGREMRVLKNQTVLIKNAHIVYGKWQFQANTIHWNKQTSTLKSQSKVVFLNEFMQGHATELTLNLENGRGVFQNPIVQVFQNPKTSEEQKITGLQAETLPKPLANSAGNVDATQTLSASAPLAFSAKTLSITNLKQNSLSKAPPFVFHEGSVNWGQWNIEGDTLMLWPDTKAIQATGKVRLSNAVLKAQANALEGDLKQQQIVLKKARIQRLDTGLRVVSERAVLYQDGQRSTLYTCKITVCPTPPFWEVEAQKVQFSLNETGVATNAVLKFKDHPFFWAPWIAFPVGNARRSGFITPLLLRETSSDPRLNLGTRFKFPFFWAPRPTFDFTLTPQWIENRGLGLDVEHRYTYLPQQWGLLEAWVSKAHPSDATSNQHPSPNQDIPRYWLEYGHRQHWQNGASMQLQASHASDGLVRRQYHQKPGRPWRSYRVGAGRQFALGDVLAVAEHHVEYEGETLADNTRLQSTLPNSVRQNPVLRQWGGWDVPFGKNGHLFFHLQSAVFQFESPGLLSGQAKWLQPGVALPFRLGVFEIRPLLEQRWITHNQLKQGGKTPLPSSQFRQDEFNTSILLPLFKRSVRGKGSLAVKRLIPLINLHWRQNTAQPHTTAVVAQQSAVRTAFFRLSHHWQKQIALQGPLVETAAVHLEQPYDALRRAAAAALKTQVPIHKPLTQRGEPWQPLVLRAHWRHTHWQATGSAHYHHQQQRIHRWATRLEHTSARMTFRIDARRNRFEYLGRNDALQLEDYSVKPSVLLRTSARHQWDVSALFDLRRSSERPLNRSFQSGSFTWKYLGTCHQIGISAQNSVVAATDNNTQRTRYNSNTKYAISFSLNAQAYTPSLKEEAQFNPIFLGHATPSSTPRCFF